MTVVVCADVGSTYTKAAAVELGTGALAGTAERRTTVDSDVLRGLDAAIAAALPAGVEAASTDVCSSAGGGLRLAVVGYEQLVTAEAGQRVGLSAGARVVHVAAGRLDRAGLAALRADRPDVVLLVGGTDGGDEEVLLHNARRLATVSRQLPVVVAGNTAARDAVAALLGPRAVPTDNVLPRIGELNPGPARSAIREVFLRHVIGGKHLSRGPRFPSLVRGPTPDLVLTAVELLAERVGGDVLTIDVGGATTDVYSVLSPDPEAPPPAAVAGTLWHSRTVEGDLGMRWSAPGVVAAARAERLLDAAQAARLADAAQARADDPAFLPATPAEYAAELALARLAALVAVRRHARAEPRRDLSRVQLLVGSGGVLRHAAPSPARDRVLAAVLGDHAGGWALPRQARAVVDVNYVLAPAGLLAAAHRDTAAALVMQMAHGATGVASTA